MNDKVPDDEKEAPEWMNKEFFEEILKKTEKDDSLEVTKVISKPGSKVGDHYASVMFRALITYNNSKQKGVETSLIIKTMPFLEGPKKDLLEQGDLFKIEIKMYSEVIPMFEKALKHDTAIACKCLYSSLEPHQTMVFEDLVKRNYRSPGNADDDMFLVAMKALEKLAKWHAISYKSNLDDGEISKNFEKGPFRDFFLESVPLFRDGFNSFLAMIKSEPEFKDYVPKFEKLIADNVLHKSQMGFNAFVNKDNVNLFVLNHGDAHLKNTMIHKAEGELDDVLLIDFQTCYWGPAVIDLMYFLYMSMDAESRFHKRDEIIYTYHKHFTKTLEIIGFTGKIPKLTDIYKDFLTFKDYELMLITTLLPCSCESHEQKGEADSGQVMDNEEYRKSLYYKTGYQNVLKQILPSLLHKGYLD